MLATWDPEPVLSRGSRGLSACGFGPWLLFPDRRPTFGHLFLSNWYLLELQFLSIELARIEGTETALFSWARFWGDRDGHVLCLVGGSHASFLG